MWQATGAQGLVAGSAVAAACALALAVAWADWRQVRAAQPPTGKADAVEAPGGAVDVGDGRSAALAGLPAAALFGPATQPSMPGAAPPPATDDEAELPEAAASFRIFGLIDAGQPARARAILGTSDVDQRQYRVGEDTPDGARLHAIRPRALVLDRGGRLEVVKLPTPELADGPAPAARPRFLPRPLARLMPPPQPPAPVAEQSTPD
jgi:general secretion pathway protein C